MCWITLGKTPFLEKCSKAGGAALLKFGMHDLGGIYVSYSPMQRKGWDAVDLYHQRERRISKTRPITLVFCNTSPIIWQEMATAIT